MHAYRIAKATCIPGQHPSTEMGSTILRHHTTPHHTTATASSPQELFPGAPPRSGESYRARAPEGSLQCVLGLQREAGRQARVRASLCCR